MEEDAQRSPEENSNPSPETDPYPPGPTADGLVNFLSNGDHPVELWPRPERSYEAFKQGLERKYVLVRFADTRGGTEVGFRLDREKSRLEGADWQQGRGRVHLEGDLRLNGVAVRCLAEIDLETLRGQGRLVPAGTA
jgi:core binding factor beta subunit